MAAYDKSQYAPVANEYLNMLDMALDMSVSILDENLDYLYLNTATYESLGLTPDEIGPGDNLQRIHQLMHEKGLLNPEIIETNKLSQEQQVQRGPASRYSKVMRLADGRTMRLTRTQLENGHTISVSSDVTELVEKERLLEHSMRLGKSGYWEFDFSKSKLVLSDTLSAHFGRDQARMAISKGLKGMVQLIVPEDRPIAIKSLKKVMKGQKRIAYRVRSKNAAGKIIWSQNYGEVIYNKKNKPEKIRVFVIDITSDVKRSLELEKAKDQALAASRAKSEFLANMSHEIRTPMNGILGMAELLANSDISAQKKQQVDIIYSSANALLNIINDILDFSKIEADALELDPVSFDLFEVVNEVAVLMSQAAQAKDLELIVNYESPRECHFIADAGRIRQIITNLVNNAIKFTEHGTIVINVDVSSNSESTNVVNICVKDTGIGIDNRKIEDIFANFTQADTSTTRRFGGTGLGLTISKKLAEMMNGRISVESELGVGSTFSFTVPLQVDKSVKPQTFDLTSLRGKRVLIVDDIDVNCHVLERRLKSWEVETAVTNDGIEALELIKKTQKAGVAFDLIILDYLMPGMNGLEFASMLKNSALIEDIPVLMLSSSDQPLSIHELRDINIKSFMMKPAVEKLLHDEMVQILSRLDDVKASKQTALPQDNMSDENKRSTILVAEDLHMNQQVISLMMEETEFIPEFANNGKIALDMYMADPSKYVAVLMDVSMPVMDGYLASQKIIEFEYENNLTHCPIIALTGHALKNDRKQCMEAGMNDYLTKPVRQEHLLKLLRQWTNQSRTLLLAS